MRTSNYEVPGPGPKIRVAGVAFGNFRHVLEYFCVTILENLKFPKAC